MRTIVLMVACMVGCQSADNQRSPQDVAGPSQSPPPFACVGNEAAWLDGQPYNTVSDAIVAASQGGWIWVCPGVHEVDHGLTYTGELVIASATDDPTTTKLTGGNLHGILSLTDAGPSRLTLRALDLADGNGPFGGAISVIGTAELVIERCSFTSNSSPDAGGAIHFNSKGRLEVRESTFVDNVSQDSGGAIQLYGTLLLEDSHFEGNEARWDGGAVHASLPWFNNRNDVQIARTNFRDNRAYNGGALQLDVGPGVLELVDVGFLNNTAEDAGAALLEGQEDILVSRARVVNNHADHGAGGIEILGRPARRARISDSTFEGNTSDYSDAALATGNVDLVEILDSRFVGVSPPHGPIVNLDADVELRFARSQVLAGPQAVAESLVELDAPVAIFDDVTLVGNGGTGLIMTGNTAPPRRQLLIRGGGIGGSDIGLRMTGSWEVRVEDLRFPQGTLANGTDIEDCGVLPSPASFLLDPASGLFCL